jgi:hypothetical protein
MAKFKIGDRVRNLEDNGAVILGATGTIDEDGSYVPFVIWDEPSMIKTTRSDNRTARLEEHLELITKEQDNTMTTEQKINELQAQIDALRAELDKPKRPISEDDFTEAMHIEFNNNHHQAWIALRKLIILRDAWGGGDRGNDHTDIVPYSIRAKGINIFTISFPNQQTRDEFQQQFADLIKTASPLLG